MSTRWTRAWLLITVSGFAFGGIHPAGADCAAPQVSFSPDRVAAGGSLVISGRFWDDICDDVGGGGCLGDDGFDSQPSQNIELTLKPLGSNGESIALGVADANDQLDFRFEVTLPPDLSPGRYRVIADHVKTREVLVVRAP